MPVNRKGASRTGVLTLAGGLALLNAAAPSFAQVAAEPVSSAQAQVYEPAYFARFAPRTAADMVGNIPGFSITGGGDDQRGFGQASQNVLINGRRVSGKANDAATALGRITAESVLRIEIVDGATLDIPGLSGQVANVIASVDALSGNWNWNPEFRERAKPAWSRGSVSANGKTEDGWSWSAELGAFEFNNRIEGPGIISDGAGNVTDVRREGFTGSGNGPRLAATLTYEAPEGSVANLNMSFGGFNFRGREDSFRSPVSAAPSARFATFADEQTEGEFGADYEFDLGPGRLKMIGLQRFQEESDLVTVESFDQPGAFIDGSGARALERAETGESILRGEYGFSALDGEIQLAAEGAFNFLDLGTDLGERQTDGSYLMTPLPEGTARVEERRAETNLSHSRQLDSAWSLQSSLGAEYSELTQTGANGQTREFVRPKGFVSVAWKPDSDFDFNLKVAREVGQLEFGDFLSSVDIQNDNQSSGNAQLVPEQEWQVSTETNRKLGPWGAIKFTTLVSFIEDVVDRVPIGANGQPVSAIADIRGQGVGNIDKAWAVSPAVSGTINFDPLGAKGLQAEFNLRYRISEVEDPLTGETREISGSTKMSGLLALRWDIPETSWTLGAGVEERQNYANFRLDQISRNWQDPSITFASIENKDVFGMRVRLQASNLNDTSENFKREVYQSASPGQPRLRTNPIDFVEERYRTFGPIIRLEVSGAF